MVSIDGTVPPPAGLSTYYTQAMSQFTVCRQPWNEYLTYLSRVDGEALIPEMHLPPMYRGRKKGMEGNLAGEQVQLHYRRFPDEHILSSLTRWRTGQTIGDVALQQFRNAQPLMIERRDPQGLDTPSPDVYMKLNYKNPATISRYLTRVGHYYPRDVLPMNPEAFKLLRRGLKRAKVLGLYPSTGNPFWFRSQRDRVKPGGDVYNAELATTKQTMEHYSYNWLQTYRIKHYFQSIEQRSKGFRSVQQSKQMAQHDGYDSARSAAINKHSVALNYGPGDVAHSVKEPKVAGLMSTAGLRRNFNLYSGVSKRRMGFPNPIHSIKKL